MLEFDVHEDILTVYGQLKHADALGVLRHSLLATATHEILPEGKTRSTIQREIKEKERAQTIIARKFANAKIDEYLFCLSNNIHWQPGTVSNGVCIL